MNFSKYKNNFLLWVFFLFNMEVVINICHADISGTNPRVEKTGGPPFFMGYLWHLHQPLYWPSAIGANYPRMERAWDTIQRQDQGRKHPQPEKLRDIFSVDDRVQAYQWRMRNALQSIFFQKLSGAQVSYSGALIENISSLGDVSALGYSPQWNQYYRQFYRELNGQGHHRLDFVNFNFHHSLGPLISTETLEMEIRLQQYLAEKTWGSQSRGYFPTEMAFAPQMIPTLKKLGVEWTILGNNHLARSAADFPLVIGSGGENCDLPNRADQLNPAQGSSSYLRLSIDRGVSPSAPIPFAFIPHKARYIDPSTGEIYKIDVVPADQALSWKDGFSPWDLNLTDPISSENSGGRPAFFLLAHDGDNAWGGGYSYYQEWVRNLSEQAQTKNIAISTVESYLQNFPVPNEDVVHVESGAWVNADSDFGSPQFINWHWPPTYKDSQGKIVVDPSKGVSDKADFWRVHVATENNVKTAQQILYPTPRLEHILNPVYGDTSVVERAWHFYLGGLDSGFVYYGCHGDECERAVEAQTHSLSGIRKLLESRASEDKTGPTLFLPQRHPWNPGGRNFGVQYNYKVTEASNNHFYVWTYGYDFSGINKMTLLVRFNKEKSPQYKESHLYENSSLLGSWQKIPLKKRIVETVLTVKPSQMADYYWTEVTEVPAGYADYYIEAEDNLGNRTRTLIQHVYIGK